MAVTYLGAGPIGNQATAGSNLTLTLPTVSGGVLASDFLVALVINNTVSTWATTAFNAAGFTRRNVNTSGTTQSPSGAIFYKKATGGETGTIVGTSPGGTSQGIVLGYRGIDPTTAFDAADVVPLFGATAVYDVPTQTASVADVAQLILGYANSATGTFTPPTNPAAFTELADNVIASTPHLWVGHLLGRPAGATGTRNLVRSAGIRGGAIGVLLKPLPPAVTQAAYRFYADGTETGSTGLGTQDTAYGADLTSGDVNLGLRVRLQETSGTAPAATDDWTLQWEKNASGSWADVTASTAEVLADSYPLAQQSNLWGMASRGFNLGFRGQSFLGNGQYLSRAKVCLRKVLAPTCDLIGVLASHTGTFGVDGTKVASLKTSTPVAGASLSTSFALVEFDFDDTYQLTSGTPYFIGAHPAAAGGLFDATNTFDVGADSSSPTHPGGFSENAAFDMPFEVYTIPLVSTVVPYASANLTDAGATTNRLTGGSGSFVAGKVSEDGTADDVGWSGSNFTELLYSLTLKSADLANADTLRFRVLKNGATTGLTYTATPTVNVTIGGGGPATIHATAVGTEAGTGTVVAKRTVRGITAVGVEAGAGTVAAKVKHPATAAGTQAGAGSAIATPSAPATTVHAVAGATQAGSAAVVGKVRHPATAGASQASTGAVIAKRTVRGITAVGTQAGTGTAVARRTVRGITAVGTQAGTGTAVAKPKHPATAIGAGAGTGTALARVKHPATAAGTNAGTGTVAATRYAPATTIHATAVGTQRGVGAVAATVTRGPVHATAVGTQAGAGSAVAKLRHPARLVGVQAGTAVAVARVKHSGTAAASGSGSGGVVAVRTVHVYAVGTQAGTGSATTIEDPWKRIGIPDPGPVVPLTPPGVRVPATGPVPRVPVDVAETRVPVDAAEARTPTIA